MEEKVVHCESSTKDELGTTLQLWNDTYGGVVKLSLLYCFNCLHQLFYRNQSSFVDLPLESLSNDCEL